MDASSVLRSQLLPGCLLCLHVSRTHMLAMAAHARARARILLQTELDLHKGEANRLKREMERVEGERERLRDEARK